MKALIFFSTITLHMSILAQSTYSQNLGTPKPSTPEKLLTDAVANINAHPGPKYTINQCRADTQAWTETGDEFTKEENRGMGTLLLVGGEPRVFPNASSHVTYKDLLSRVYESEVCENTDVAFESRYKTYSVIAPLYKEEQQDRLLFFLIKNGMFQRFLDEDAASHR